MAGSTRKNARRAAREILKLFRALDGQIDRLLPQFEAKGEGPSCKRGCAACCRQVVYLSLPEAVGAIEARISRMDGSDLRIFRRRLEEHARQFPRNADRHEWWIRQVPCVLLDTDETCSVYDARPIACRTYFVTSDPKLCGPMGNGRTLKILNLGSFHDRYAAELGRLHSKYGTSIEVKPHPIALLEAFDLLHPEIAVPTRLDLSLHPGR